MRYKRKPEPDFDSTYYRCSVCDTVNTFRGTPSGGIYDPSFTDTGESSLVGQTKTIYSTAAPGCWFCLSPASRLGGKAGDLIPPFKGRG